MEKKITDKTLPGIYQSADGSAIKAQKKYFVYQSFYSFCLIGAAIVAYFWPENSYAAIVSALLFLFTLIIMAALQIEKPDELWNNARDVAESIKSSAWKWMMKADPYLNEFEHSKKLFLNELAIIHKEHPEIFTYTTPDSFNHDPIPDMMKDVREQNLETRLQIYLEQRINDQQEWYIKKSQKNEKNFIISFICSFILHTIAFIMLLYRIQNPISLPIEIVVTCAGAFFTWGKSKKYKDLKAVYAFASYELSIIKAESDDVKSNDELSDFVLKSENAFTRERITYLARKKL